MESFSLCDTKFGKVMVAFDGAGISRVEFVAPYAELNMGDPAAPFDIVEAVVARINGESLDTIPLSLSGTDFQKKVWLELLKVPRGTTISYYNLAKNIEKPKAVRAVANTCGANKIAVLIPCHRVIRSDGELGGYAWGTDLKKDLLDFEKHN